MFQPSDAHAQEVGHRSFAPTVAVGASSFLVDLEDPSSDLGIVVRSGVRAHDYGLTASLEHWRSIANFSFTSVTLEGALVLGGGSLVRPYLLLGIGHTQSDYHGQAVRYEEADGTAATLGPGLAVLMSNSIGVEAQALLRTDDGGYNFSLRGLVSWNPGLQALPETPADTFGGPLVCWLTPISGPWRFVEPGFGLRFTRERDGAVSPTVAFAVLHWQIPGRALLRDYVWDTRAFLAMPGLEWAAGGGLETTIRLGPSVTIMGEGPGNGANVGAYAEATVSPEWLGGFYLGAGWLWMPNDAGGDPRVSTTDQHGILTSFGLRL